MPLRSPGAPDLDAVLAVLVRRIDKLATMAALLDLLGWTEEADSTRAVAARLRHKLGLLLAGADPMSGTPRVLH